MTGRPLVIDASAVVELLLATPAGAQVAEHIRGHALFAPELLDAEVLAALKGLERGQIVTAPRAAEAVEDLARVPVDRWSLPLLVAGAWELRDRLSAYDAFYLALARAVRCPVLTADRRWARTGDLGVTVITVG